MAREMAHIKPGKTYANEDTLRKAVEDLPESYRYIIAYTKEGRCYPIFGGHEAMGAAHKGFIVIA